MMAAMPPIWTVVLSFPSQEGRKPRKPVIMLIAAAPTMMKTSRLMTAIVTQKGTGKWLGQGLWKNAAHREHDERRHQHQLVGNGIENGAELRLLIKAPRQSPSSPSVRPAIQIPPAPKETADKKEAYENRNEHHPEDGEHVGDGKNSGGH